jgi:hypothetical protein
MQVEDLSQPCLIFLCEQDEVVPTAEVIRYIETHDKVGGPLWP